MQQQPIISQSQFLLQYFLLESLVQEDLPQERKPALPDPNPIDRPKC